MAETRKMWFQDIRFSLRLLGRHKSFYAITILTLAVGIGATTSIFNVTNQALLGSLPYRDPGQLVAAWTPGTVPKGVFLTLRHRNLHTLTAIAAYSTSGFNLTRNGEAKRLIGSFVSGNLFSVLEGPPPLMGRTLQTGDDDVGQDHAAVISYQLWQDQFQGDSKIIGRTIDLNNMGYQIVGIMPNEFHFPSKETQLWVPLQIDPANSIDLWGINSLTMIGRLRGVADTRDATAEIRSIVPRLRTSFPWNMPNEWGSTVSVISLHQSIVGNFRTKALVLFAAVIALLLISCANIGNLMLFRALGRQREITMRLALGANGVRIFTQLIIESVVIALCGGVAGLLLALMGTSLLQSILPATTPYLGEVRFGGPAFLFALLISIFSGILFGLAPSLQAKHANLVDVLKSSDDRLTTGRRQRYLQSFLVCGEIALSVMLVIAAGLMIKTLRNLEHVKIGFTSQHLLSARIDLNSSNCNTAAKCFVFYDDLLSRVRSQGGIRKAAIVNGLPLSGGVFPFPLEAEGYPIGSGALPPTATKYIISPGYFSTMQIPILRGRTFTAQDQPNTPGVVIVSASMAQHFWPNQNPIGKRIRPLWQQQWRTIVGVAGDVKSYAVGDAPNWAPKWAVYIPYTQSGTYGADNTPWAMTLVVRTAGRPANYAETLRSLLANVNPSVPMSNINTMEDILAISLSNPKSIMSLLTGFAGVAIALAIVGIYGILAFSVRARDAELSLRLALGAQARDLILLVVRQAMFLALLGIGIGLVGAALLVRVLHGMLFGVAPLDPVTFVVSPVVILAAALVASYVPARRASNVDPTKVLRG